MPMPLEPYLDAAPQLAAMFSCTPAHKVIGDVQLGDDSSVGATPCCAAM